MKPFNSSNQPGLYGRGKRATQSGVALVITLILLAVITFMAVTFLVISRSERGAVTTTTDQTISRLAADSGLEHAKADLLIPMMAENNPFLMKLAVSTNYVNQFGFAPGIISPTNVNFDHTINGGNLSPDNWRENIGNLLYRPRVPVFMRDRATGRLQDFQFYYDVNQNGMYEPNGLQYVTNEFNQRVLDQDGNPVMQYMTGDPEWVGELEYPGRPHSGTNRFVSRWAYIISPVGQTLDLNYMHNAGRYLNLNAGDGFVRNQGAGTWEINMGAFLTDLNTNMWFNPANINNGWGYGYDYRTSLNLNNEGAGFDDATALLRYRYNGDWNTLWRPTALFPRAIPAFLVDGYDTYGSGAQGTVMNTAGSYAQDPDQLDNRGTRPWPGAYNERLFVSPSDLLDRQKTSIGVTGRSLTDRLKEASTRNSTYDRYTFHRLLAQVGTESPPEDPKINVNYKNMDRGRIIANYQTNFYEWTPVDFFTNAATKLLANSGFAFALTNIQIWPTNFYTPSVHRALQLAANIYDATTNNPMPSVFRPLFEMRPLPGGGSNGVFIAGYEHVPNVASMSGLTWRDVQDRSLTSIGKRDMVYGIPLVVGAKKGHPNFNEFAMETKMQVTRKLEFLRGGNGGITTNQMITVGMQNIFGLEAWNSYLQTNANNIRINAQVQVFPSLTNRVGKLLHPAAVSTNVGINASTNFTIARGQWKAFNNATTRRNDGSLIPVLTNFTLMLPNSTFRESGQLFQTPAHGNFEDNQGFPLQDWGLNLRVRVTFSMVSTGPDGQEHFIDYVNLAETVPTINLAQVLQKEQRDSLVIPTKDHVANGSISAMWLTNRPNWSHDVRVPTFGVLNQIAVSLNEVTSPQWRTQTNQAAIDFFRHQFGLSSKFAGTGPFTITNTFYAPYSPTREVYLFTRWQANDPLVHYTPGDLADQGRPITWDFTAASSTVTNVGFLNARYDPWAFPGKTGKNRTDLSLKDPLMKRSDDWNFPTNKLANVGWLGRVHRGTPWQTVYLKSSRALTNTWMDWAGSGLTYTNVGQVKASLVKLGTLVDDSILSIPLQDWAIPDLFTAAIVDNATRGQLSINQDGVAAWSAVLSGVPVLTNLSVGAFTNIQPAAVDPGGVQFIVDGINRTRDLRPGKVFRRLAEICSVPELTVASPYIEHDGPVGSTRDTVSDEVYERIPQQILGLLRCEDTPKFVVYSYGQSLKPAAGSLITSGPYSGMCTNYQVTAEVATRAVVRVDGAPANPRVTVENFTIVPP